MTPRSKKLLALVTKSTSTRTPGQRGSRNVGATPCGRPQLLRPIGQGDHTGSPLHNAPDLAQPH